jgi:hypothetical protein
MSVEASSEKAAINKAKKQQKAAIGSEWWPCISLGFRADLVRAVK